MAIKTYILSGKARWAKIIGKAPPGYDNGPAEWSFDLVLDEEEQERYVKSGGNKFYLKTNKDGETFIKFSRKAVKKDGTESQPIDVVDHRNQAWDNRLIGNDSTLNVCYTLNPVKSKGTEKMKPSVLSVQVWDYVKYQPKGPFGSKEDGQSASTEVAESWT